MLKGGTNNMSENQDSAHKITILMRNVTIQQWMEWGAVVFIEPTRVRMKIKYGGCIVHWANADCIIVDFCLYIYCIDMCISPFLFLYVHSTSDEILLRVSSPVLFHGKGAPE